MQTPYHTHDVITHKAYQKIICNYTTAAICNYMANTQKLWQNCTTSSSLPINELSIHYKVLH